MRRAALAVVLSVALAGCAAPKFSELPEVYRAGITGNPEVKSTMRGVTYMDLREGTGEGAAYGERAVIEYSVKLEDGFEIDTSRGGPPLNFRIGSGKVVAGVEDGIIGMKLNGKRRLIIPSRLAYGRKGVPGTIPPDATLIFDLDLLALRQ